MTNPTPSAIRWIDLDASLAIPCSWCRHSEFVHTDAGPVCPVSASAPRFFPMVGVAEPAD